MSQKLNLTFVATVDFDFVAHSVFGDQKESACGPDITYFTACHCRIHECLFVSSVII